MKTTTHLEAHTLTIHTVQSQQSEVLYCLHSMAKLECETMVRQAEPALKRYIKPGFHCGAM